MGGVFEYIAFLFIVLLIYNLYKNNAFSYSYFDYFSSRRGVDAEVGSGTVFDSILTFFGFPFFIFISVLKKSRRLFFLGIFFIFGFSYLYQVNYPIIYFFWIYLIENFLLRSNFRRRSKMPIFAAAWLIVVIFLAAVNRFGSFDINGVFEYYFFNYHILGFSYFDSIFLDSKSFLHDHSLGILSFGVIFQLPAIILNKLGYPDLFIFYDNYSYYLSSVRDIGRHEYVGTNAFNTLLGTFYKDFGVFGAILPPFIYGFFMMKNYIKSYVSNFSRGLFIILAFSWIVGVMISPVGRPYFWMSIAMILLVSDIHKKSHKSFQ